MNIERCGECGFDGSVWTDDRAMEAIGSLPVEWSEAVARVEPADLARRPIAEMWSIAEYVDHVREVLFGMRFVLDSALADPGVQLGAPPEPPFDPTPRAIDVAAALRGIEHEATSLKERLATLVGEEWTVTATVGEEQLDARWIARHAVHDAHHHLSDVQRLREALRRPAHE